MANPLDNVEFHAGGTDEVGNCCHLVKEDAPCIITRIGGPCSCGQNNPESIVLHVECLELVRHDTEWAKTAAFFGVAANIKPGATS